MRVTGTQPGIFRGRTGFLEAGFLFLKVHFDKHFMYDIQNKGFAWKDFRVFSPDTLKTAFQMRI